MGRPSFRARRVALDHRPGGRSRHPPTGWVGSMPRSISRTTCRRSRPSATPSSMPGSRPPSSPGWAAAAWRRTCCIGPSAPARATSTCASSIRPIRRRSARSLTTSIHSGRSSSSRQVRHDRRAECVRRWQRVEDALERVHHHVTSGPAMRSSPSPIRARAPRPSPITTSSVDLPQQPERRRPVQRADLCRARARVAHRSRPRPARRSANAMLGACRAPDPDANPGVSPRRRDAGRDGRDKLTFLTDEEIASFGAWAEQLLAESTGKHGVGIVPIDLEPLGAVGSYGDDRVFVRIALEDSADGGRDALADALCRRRPSGHPHLDRRPDRSRRGVRPLGGRHRDRRHHPGHRPVRPTQRRGGQAADSGRAGQGRARRAADLERDGGPRRRADAADRLREHLARRRPDAPISPSRRSSRRRGAGRGHGSHPGPSP